MFFLFKMIFLCNKILRKTAYNFDDNLISLLLRINATFELLSREISSPDNYLIDFTKHENVFATFKNNFIAHKYS